MGARRIWLAVVHAEGLPLASVCAAQTTPLQTDGGDTEQFVLQWSTKGVARGEPPGVPPRLEKGAALDSGGQIVMRMGTVGAVFEGRF